jgi:hypothetical protein
MLPVGDAVPGVPKVMFNQNRNLMLQGYSHDHSDLRTPHSSPEVVATLAAPFRSLTADEMRRCRERACTTPRAILNER